MKYIFAFLFLLCAYNNIFSQTNYNSGRVIFHTTHLKTDMFAELPIELKLQLKIVGVHRKTVEDSSFFTSFQKQTGSFNPPIPADAILGNICIPHKSPLKIFDTRKSTVIFAGHDATDEEERFFVSPLVRVGQNAVFVGEDKIAGFKCQIFEQKTPSDTVRFWLTKDLPETAGLTFFDKSVAKGAVMKIKNSIFVMEIDEIAAQPVETQLIKTENLVIQPSPTLVAANPICWKVAAPLPDFIGYDLDGKKYTAASLKGKKTIFMFIPEMKQNALYRQDLLKILLEKWSTDANIQLIGVFNGSSLAAKKVLKTIGGTFPIIPNASDWTNESNMTERLDFALVDENGVIKYLHEAFEKKNTPSAATKTYTSIEEVAAKINQQMFNP